MNITGFDRDSNIHNTIPNTSVSEVMNDTRCTEVRVRPTEGSRDLTAGLAVSHAICMVRARRGIALLFLGTLLFFPIL